MLYQVVQLVGLGNDLNDPGFAPCWLAIESFSPPAIAEHQCRFKRALAGNIAHSNGERCRTWNFGKHKRLAHRCLHRHGCLNVDFQVEGSRAGNTRTELCIGLRLQVRHVRYRTDCKCVQRDDRGDEAVIPERSASAALLARNPLGGSPLELNHESNHLHRRPCRHRLVHCRVFRPALRAEQGRTRRFGVAWTIPWMNGSSAGRRRESRFAMTSIRCLGKKPAVVC